MVNFPMGQGEINYYNFLMTMNNNNIFPINEKTTVGYYMSSFKSPSVKKTNVKVLLVKQPVSIFFVYFFSVLVLLFLLGMQFYDVNPLFPHLIK